jgi:hypothetical protein
VIPLAAIDGPLGPASGGRIQRLVKVCGRRGECHARRLRGLQFGGTLADAVLIGDRVPACPATLPGPPNPDGGLQLSEQPEHVVAVLASLLGKRPADVTYGATHLTRLRPGRTEGK